MPNDKVSDWVVKKIQECNNSKAARQNAKVSAPNSPVQKRWLVRAQELENKENKSSS